MRSVLGIAVFAGALLCAPDVFAVKGRTMFHYIAYEAAFWPKAAPATAAQYPKVELDSLAKLPFDVLVFAPEFGFGAMAGILNSASYPKHQPESRWMQNWRNAMPELVKAGVDPIAETVKWCRKNGKEAVVCLSANPMGSHSSRPTSDKPITSWYAYLWPDFKASNTDCLIDPSGAGKAAYGSGNCVDYSHAKVRDKLAAIANEIAAKYDIDGIMIDFMRSPTLFRSVAEGGTAAPKEVELISQMMQRIKGSCKAASTRLGHSVSLAARVPDSVGYCKDIGVDLQGWLDTKMLDYVVLGGSFQLNRWGVVGGAAVKAGVPFYVSFTQSGIYVGNDSGHAGDDERVPRHSKNAIRARIADALQYKATGCMFSMGTHWEHSLGKGSVVAFDEKANRLADKRYFVSYTNERAAGSALKDGNKYIGKDVLVSGSPVDLAKGSAKTNIDVWDDFAALKRDGVTPKVTLITEVSIPSGISTEVTFNGKPYKPFKKRAGTQLYDVPPSAVKLGANEVTVKAKGRNKRGQTAKFGNVVVEVAFPAADKPAAEKTGGGK